MGQMGRMGQMDRQGGDRDTQNVQRICLGNSGNGMYPEPAATGAFRAQGLEQQEQPGLPSPGPGCGNSGMKPRGLDAIPLPLGSVLGCSQSVLDSGCSSLIPVAVFFPSPSEITPVGFPKIKSSALVLTLGLNHLSNGSLGIPSFPKI